MHSAPVQPSWAGLGWHSTAHGLCQAWGSPDQPSPSSVPHFSLDLHQNIPSALPGLRNPAFMHITWRRSQNSQTTFFWLVFAKSEKQNAKRRLGFIFPLRKVLRYFNTFQLYFCLLWLIIIPRKLEIGIYLIPDFFLSFFFSFFSFDYWQTLIYYNRSVRNTGVHETPFFLIPACPNPLRPPKKNYICLSFCNVFIFFKYMFL